jgi:hypothetical protein
MLLGFSALHHSSCRGGVLPKPTCDTSCEERIDASLEPGETLLRVWYTKLGKRVAYLKTRGSGYYWVFDGADYGPYEIQRDLPDRIGELSFSESGKRVAFVARDKEGEIIVADGSPIRMTGWARRRYPTFSPDERRFAFVDSHRDGQFVVQGGTRGPSFDRVRRLMFSPDSKSLTYVGRRDSKECVVLDLVPGPFFDEIINVYFSKDRRGHRYIARDGGELVLVVGGRESRRFKNAREVRWDEESRRSVIYERGDKAVLEIDGSVEGEFEDVRLPTFSDEGGCMAYAKREQGSWVVTWKGSAMGPFDEPPAIVPSRTGWRIGLVGRRGGSWFARVDEKWSQPYSFVMGLVFSNDEARYFYQATDAESKSFLVLDGREGDRFDEIFVPSFCENGTHLRFGARRGSTLLWKVRSVR